MTTPESTSLALLDAITEYAGRDMRGSFPPNVVQHAKRLLLDGISWMVMGARKEEAQPLLSLATSGAEGGACTVVGTGHQTNVIDALFANTALAQVHDCNDGRRLARRDGGSNHPGRCIIPAALTFAQRHNLTGSELLELVVMGYEVVSRVRAGHPDGEYSFAVAAMLSRVMGRGADSMRRALALARLTFPERPEGRRYDTDFDFLSQGFIARAAASATLYADAAGSLPFEDAEAQLASSFPGSGPSTQDRYEILSVYLKPYPCCRALHGAIDLALALRSLGTFSAPDIATVEVRVGNTKRFLLEPAAPDATYKRCQFSIPFVTACALLDGHVGEASFTRARIGSDDVARLQQRIGCVYDEALQFNPSGFASHFRPSILTVTTVQGAQFTKDLAVPRGSPLNPLTEAELLAKFQSWTGAGLSPERKEQVVAMVRDLESLGNVSELMRLL